MKWCIWISFLVFGQMGFAQDSTYLAKNARICDTCFSTLYVRHMECTECKDIYVDSGTVFLPHSVVTAFQSLVKTRKSMDKRGHVPHKINTYDLYFEDPKSFDKLWKGLHDFHKRYKITGKVVQLDGYSLRFKLTSFQRLKKDKRTMK